MWTRYLSGTIALIGTLLTTPAIQAKQKGKSYVLPGDNKLPLTLESFCEGVPNVTKITEQNITAELGTLCNNGVPTQVFRDLFANPYQGVGNAEDFITQLPPTETLVGNQIQLNIAFAMRVDKASVKALIAEEPNALVPYSGQFLNITTKFLAPPENNGEADTSFMVEQFVDVNRDGRAVFKDTSSHRLNMYRLQPDNYDFFLAARTLVSSKTEDGALINDNQLADPGKQFEKANVVRGFMSDPANASGSTYIFSIINIVMNSRDTPGSNVSDGMIEVFTEFLSGSLVDAYNAHK